MNPVAPIDIVAKNHLNVLIRLAYADKNCIDLEREMIFDIGRKRNFPDSYIDKLLQNPEPIGTLGALSLNQKLDYLLDCVDLVHIDLKVLECELNFCSEIALKMGLKKNVIEFLIENRMSLSREELIAKVYNEFMV
jgi:hypothetical protein